MASKLEDLIAALFEFSTSGNNNVTKDVADATLQSLGKLGVEQPKIFLNSIHTFLLHNGKKMAEKDKAFIFRCLANVLAEAKVLDECEEQQILLIVNLCTQEMSMAKDVENGLASAAKEVLVTVAGQCNKFINHVVDSLLSKFQPGASTPPHRYIVFTLSEIAQKNPTGFVPFLHDILARTGALLPHIKSDPVRSAFSQALCAFAESVKEFASRQQRQSFDSADEKGAEVVAIEGEAEHDQQEASEAGMDEIHENFADQFEAAYDVVIGWPSSSKDYKSRADAAECVGTLCLMIQRERVLKDLKKLDTLFRTLHKKSGTPEEQLAIVKGIANFLHSSCQEDSIPIEHYINDLFEMLFPHVCLITEQNLPTDDTPTPNLLQIRIRNEVFRCFQACSCRAADKEIYFLLHKMQSQSEAVKLGAINLLRHLLNAADDHMKDNRSLLTMGLKPFLTDELVYTRVKMTLCQLAIALADNDYVQADEAGAQVMQFLLTNLVYRSDPNLKRSSVQSVGGATSEASLASQLNAQCAQALYTISKTSKSAQELLWPLLFEYMCQEQYSPVVTDIFKCLRILCARIRDEKGSAVEPIDFESNFRLPGPIPLMCRLLVFMNGAPLAPALNARAREALLLFGELAPWFHATKFNISKNNDGNDDEKNLVQKCVAQLMEKLDGDFASSASSPLKKVEGGKKKTLLSKRNSSKEAAAADYMGMEFKSTRIQRWQTALLDMLCTLVDAVEDQDWRQSLAAAQTKQLSLFSSSSSSDPTQQQQPQQPAHDKAFLMRCLGCTLARVQCPAFIRDHLYLLFRQTQHSVVAERVGCAMAVGHCASLLDHTDLVLTELEQISKWEHMKEKKPGGGSTSSSVFSFIKESTFGRSVDAEILNLRATIVLSFGYVVYYCPPEGLVLRLQNTVLTFLRQYTAVSKDALLREAHLETLNLIALSVHSSRLRDYRFESRYECLSYIKEYVNDEKSPDSLSSWIRLLAAKASASLVLLEPPLSENEFLDLSNVLIQNIFPICRERSGLKTLDQQCVYGFSHIFLHTKGSKKKQQQQHHQQRMMMTEYHHHLPEKISSTFPASPAKKTTKQHKDAASKAKVKEKAGAAGGGGTKGSSSSATTAAANGNKIEDDEASTVMEATVIQCRAAIANCVMMRPSVMPTVDELLRLFYQYYGSERDHERSRAVDFTVLVLQVYSRNADDCRLGKATEFAPLATLLGRLGPRLCDSLAQVRLQALRAIWLTFKLSLLHRGHSPLEDLDADLEEQGEEENAALFSVERFVDTHFGGGAQEGRLDSNKCSAAIMAISKEIEKRLPQSQVQTYIQILFKMLSDRQSNVSSAAAQLLRCIISDRAQSLHKEAEILLINLLDHLARSSQDKIQTYTELLNGFTLFSGHHLQLAIHVLLRQSLPYNQTVSEVWEMMARVHFTGIMDYLLELVRTSNGPPAPAAAGHTPSKQQQNRPTSHGGGEEHADFGVEATEGVVGTSTTTSPTQNAPQNAQLSPTQHELPRGGGGGGGAFASSSSPSPLFCPSHFELINIGGGTVIKVVSDEACALVSALTEMIRKGEPEDELLKRVPLLVTALLQVLVSLVDTQYSNVQKNATLDIGGTAAAAAAQQSTSNGVAKKEKQRAKPIVPVVTAELTRLHDAPAKLVAEALKALLNRINAANVVERMNGERAWTNITSAQHYIPAITSFCCALLDFRPHFIGALMTLEVECLQMGPRNTSDAERIAAIAVLSALITKCPRENGEFDSALFSTTFQAIQAVLHDPNLIVRKLAVNGVGHLGQLKGPEADELIIRYSQHSIEAALAGLDDHWDRQDQLATEAIASLDSLVKVCQPTLLLNVLPQLLLKVRPCFEKENPTLRANSFSLYAGLGRVVGTCEAFRESLHSNIISCVLHLNDSDEAVRNSCAKVLATCIPVINSDHASALVEHELGADSGRQGPPSNYTDFLRQFGIIIPLSFPDRVNTYALDCNNYFRSMSPRIRSNAVLLMGFMLNALTAELRATLSKDLIFIGLIQMLKDPDEQVRLHTVFAISLLHNFA